MLPDPVSALLFGSFAFAEVDQQDLPKGLNLNLYLEPDFLMLTSTVSSIVRVKLQNQ